MIHQHAVECAQAAAGKHGGQVEGLEIVGRLFLRQSCGNVGGQLLWAYLIKAPFTELKNGYMVKMGVLVGTLSWAFFYVNLGPCGSKWGV